MGVVHIDAGTKELCFTWECHRFEQAAKLLLRVQKEVETHIERDVAQHPHNYDLTYPKETRVHAWLHGMLSHILSTPTPPATKKFRRDLLLFMLLSRHLPPDTYPPDTLYADLLPLCDINFADISPEGDNIGYAAQVIHRDGTHRVHHV